MAKRKCKKGYRLHDARIAYSGGTGSMRTIKYELKGDNQALVAQAVKYDHLMLYGPLNLNDYLAAPDRPSVLGFWILCLSLGCIFAEQRAIERTFKAYKKIPSQEERDFDNLPIAIREQLDYDAWITFATKEQRSLDKKSEEQRYKIVDGVLKKGTRASAQLETIFANWAKDYPKGYADKLALFGGQHSEVTMSRPTIKLGVAIDLEFEELDTSDRTAFFDRLLGYYRQACSEEQVQTFIGIGSNGNYMNSCLGFMKLLQKTKPLDSLVTALTEPYSIDQTELIKSRLARLQDYAKSLSQPELIKNWANYKSDFNGTLESWYSNYQAKQQAAQAQLFDEEKGRLSLVEQLIESLDQAKLQHADQTTEALIAQGRAIKDLILKTKNGKLDRRLTDDLDSHLAVWRQDLNEFDLQFATTSKGGKRTYSEDRPKWPKDWQKQLSKHIQSSPVFFGENKRALWQQLKSLKSEVRIQIGELKAIISLDYEEQFLIDKQVDKLAELYQRLQTINGHPAVSASLACIQDFLGLDFGQRMGKKRYFVSPFARGKYEQLDLGQSLSATIQQVVEVADLRSLLDQVLENPHEADLLRDVIQLSKVLASGLVSQSDKAVRRQLVHLHSTLQGASALMSKRQVIVRYQVQADSGGQMSIAHDASYQRYYYHFPSIKDAQTKQLHVSKDKDTKLEDIKVKPANYVGIQSSRYQIQFLDWFFGKHKRKQTSLQTKGGFTIVEEAISIDWADEYPSITSGDQRLFASQPFELVPRSSPSFNAEAIKGRYIGVDVGEYDLAWCLIEVEGEQVKVLEQGMITDQQQQSLKQDVKTLRSNQVRQTFTSPDTKIARVRASLIGSFRNQLASLSMAHSARLVFEYEIDAFESGARQIKNVYKSVKQGNVFKKDNKEPNKQAWGGKGANSFSAYEVTAADTSRICTKCKETASLHVDWEGGERLYDKVRPNLGDGKKRQFAQDKLDQAGIALDLDDFIQANGTIGLFICPNCGHITHADKQAAFNIALRGAIRDAVPEENRNKDGSIQQGTLTKDYFVAQQASYDYPAIEL